MNFMRPASGYTLEYYTHEYIKKKSPIEALLQFKQYEKRNAIFAAFSIRFITKSG